MRTLRYISYLVVLSLLFFSKTSDVFSTTSSSQPSVTITEEDLAPQGKPRVIKFSNGSLVFNLDGSASVTTGGGATSWEDLTDSTTIDAATLDGLDTSDFIRTYDVYGTATIDASDTILFRDTITGNYYRSTVQGILDLSPGAAEINNLEVIATGILAGEVPVGSGAGVVTYRQLVLDDISDSNTIGSTISWQDLADSNTINATTLNNYTSDDFADSTHHTTHEPGGTDEVNLASTDLTDSTTINAFTLQGYTPNDFADSTVVGGGTLDTAYDFGGAGAGRTITANAGRVEILANGNSGLYVSTATNANVAVFEGTGSTSGDAVQIFATGSTSGAALRMTANVLTTGRMIHATSDSADASARNLVEIVNDNVGATGATAFKIQQDANARGAEITSSHTTNPYGALYVNVPNLTTGRGVFITSTSADTGAYDLVTINDQSGAASKTSTALRVAQSGPTIALKVQSGNASATGIDIAHEGVTSRALNVVGDSLGTVNGGLARFYSNSASTNTRSLVQMHNDNTLSTSTIVLDLINDANGGGAGSYCINASQNSSSGDAAVRIVSQALVEPAITVASAGTTGFPVGLGVQANSLTTGTVLQAQSNGGATLTGSIARLNATNISNTGTCLILNQVGSGGTHMQFTGDGEKAIATPLKGEFWFNENSKELNFFDGTDTYDLIHNTKNGGSSVGDWQYDSGWFTAALNTHYTKAHGISGITVPSTMLQTLIVWRVNSSGTIMVIPDHGGDANGDEGCYSAYNATNLYVFTVGRWSQYSTGAAQAGATAGELRILARKIN